MGLLRLNTAPFYYFKSNHVSREEYRYFTHSRFCSTPSRTNGGSVAGPLKTGGTAAGDTAAAAALTADEDSAAPHRGGGGGVMVPSGRRGSPSWESGGGGVNSNSGSGGDPAPLLPGGRRAAAEIVRRFSVGDGSGGDGGGGDDGAAAAAAAAGGSGVGKMPASTTECGSGSGGGSGASGGDRYVRVAGSHVTAFLRTALLMVHICMKPPSPSSLDPDEASGGGSDGLEEKVRNNGSGRLGLLPSADDAFSPLCRFFGFPRSAEALLAEPGLLDAARR